MRETLHRDSLNERIGDNDLFLAQRGWVTIESGFSVSLEQVARSREAIQELNRIGVGDRAQVFLWQLGWGAVLEALGDLDLKVPQNLSQDRAGFGLYL